MKTATLANLRAHWPRLVAVALAIAIASAFVAATSVLSGTVQATLRASVGADLAGSQLVVQSLGGAGVGTEQRETVTATEGVAGAGIVRSSGGTLTMPDGKEQLAMISPIFSAPFPGPTLIDGALPSGTDEATIDAVTADAQSVSVGDTLQLDLGDGTTASVKITGIVDASSAPSRAGWVQLDLSEAGFSELTGVDSGSQLVIATTSGTDLAALQGRLRTQLGDAFEVLTTDAAISQTVTQASGDALVLQSVLGVFVLIALVVCALVVSNTFQVLIAQRTRELALLRVLGARRGSVFAAVVTEALIVGLVAAVVGLGFGVALMAVFIRIGAAVGVMPSGAEFAMPLETAPLAIGAGALVALLASLAPARAATSIAPLAALRPLAETDARSTAGRVRLVVGLVVLLAGAGLLGGSLALQGSVDSNGILASFALAVAGTLVSALGVVLLAVFVLPRVIRFFGALLGRRPAAKLAALNATRNPRRTTATAMALLIGVTLVATVIVGGDIAKATISNGLAARFPVDLIGLAQPGSPVDDAKLDTTEHDRIVSASLPLTSATLSSADGGDVTVFATDMDRLGTVLAVEGVDFSSTEAFVPWDTTAQEDGKLELQGPSGSVALSTASVRDYSTAIFVDSSVLDQLGVPDSERSVGVMLAVEDGSGPQLINDLASSLGSALGDGSQVDGSVLMRAQIEQVVDVLLVIVTGLLAIAVLIALIGVANTLSLSVIERTRENALLRALGMSRGALRGMLALEAVLMAGVATVVGIALGFVYGWIGASSVLGAIGSIALGNPWLQLGAVLVVAVVAGLLASIAPSRRATKLSPVAGLAQE